MTHTHWQKSPSVISFILPYCGLLCLCVSLSVCLSSPHLQSLKLPSLAVMQGSELHCNYMSTSNFKEQTSRRRKTDIIIKTKLHGYSGAVLLTRPSSFWSQLKNLQNICELKSGKKTFFPIHCIGVPKEAKMLRRFQFCEYCKDCLTISVIFFPKTLKAPSLCYKIQSSARSDAWKSCTSIWVLSPFWFCFARF